MSYEQSVVNDLINASSLSVLEFGFALRSVFESSITHVKIMERNTMVKLLINESECNEGINLTKITKYYRSQQSDCSVKNIYIGSTLDSMITYQVLTLNYFVALFSKFIGSDNLYI